ncbi:MAG TPA: 3-deoxy-D-manno-octulosonic acid transferase, partial [Porphyromonadaceae bacterium]|nr:3-deoxy-D-manno-octulosonic acid transferase [Porphyromonadaceae bacterium]
ILREKIDQNAKYIWFHASSLGEFEQGRPLIEKIKAEHPEYKILLTFFSPSGYEVRKNYGGADVVCYLWFDTPYRVKKFLDLSKPVMAIFIKYEFWDNYLSELKRRNIPVYIVSAIFRKEQLFFKWYGGMYRKVLSYFTHIFVQDDASRELLSKYGVTNVSVFGDTRFDRVQDVYKNTKQVPMVDLFVNNNRSDNQLTMVAGSSWQQDEEVYLNYFNEHPELKLIIAPHEIHKDHLMHIESMLKRPSIRLSEATEKDIKGKSCLIVDSFGLLSSIYRYGDLAYIGGGFGAGIHNVLEAAVYGIPVIFGPKYQKFKEARDLLQVGGAFSITDEKTFESKMEELSTYRDLLEAAGAAAGDFVKSNIGATNRIIASIPL